MEWIRNNTFFQRSNRSILNSEECDPQACYDSFKGHWYQALKVLQRVQQLPSHDDVLGVVNHLEQMVTLLLYDLKKNDRHCMTVNSSKCLEYLLHENVLDRLFEWSIRSGRYTNAVRSEQIKFYDTLIRHTRHLLLEHNSFLKPLLKLLNSCHQEIFWEEVNKLLVDLLNQLSTLLVQHPEYVKLFFVNEKKGNRFTIFSLLIPFVHKEDAIGMRARDALLLCMSLSKKNKDVALYISEISNFAVLLASGLSGLYSVLPNTIDDIGVPDWHRFTPDDVNEINGLLYFVTSLEFSNAIAQVAHPSIRKQLQEFLYRGFLIPVLGEALLQNNIQEQVAATAYLELIIRTVAEPGLLHAVLQFLIKVEYDGQRLLNILIQRIQSNDMQLCLVSLALFESMIDLNCEDLLLELVFKYLQPCFHLIMSQRKMLLPIDPLCPSFEKLLSLAPNCSQLLETDLDFDSSSGQWSHLKHKQSLYGKYYAYLCDARNKIGHCQKACLNWSNGYNGDDDILLNNEEKSDSLISLERSSGYESFSMINSDDIKEDHEFWQISSNKPRRVNINHSFEETPGLDEAPSAGPFLTILLDKLRVFMSNSIYVNLHLTGLISRLAVYPQTLLRAYLLDHNLVLQPNIPSIFEIIGVIKRQIDDYMSRQSDRVGLIKYAQEVLVNREIMLVNIRRYHMEKTSLPRPQPQESNESFQRNGPKRKSLTIPSITNIFGRRPSQLETCLPMINSAEEVQINSVYPKFNEAQHVALCAVLLDEWVKELAALAQEHTIAQLASLMN
ncbi:FHIP family protein AGAP011705 [Euwallacea similis]|uniref:FHIP family protein AGAP011705 n=1 Tax=Euwallacea similis TaxID=1736056 RepID=UPI00344D1E74